MRIELTITTEDIDEINRQVMLAVVEHLRSS